MSSMISCKVKIIFSLTPLTDDLGITDTEPFGKFKWEVQTRDHYIDRKCIVQKVTYTSGLYNISLYNMSTSTTQTYSDSHTQTV